MPQPIDIITQDQLDLFDRLRADAWFADVPLLLQEKGVTESDIETALSTLNDVGGKIGVVVVVLMSELAGESTSDTAAAWSDGVTIQVIEQPLFNLGDSGIGKSAALVATRIRQQLHLWGNGYGATWNFSGQNPLPVDEGKISYGVIFNRQGSDAKIAPVATPRIEATAATAPATVTITCATAGATIRYTLDGSYPSAANPEAHVYAAPLEIATTANLRAIGEKADMRSSNIRQLYLA